MDKCISSAISAVNVSNHTSHHKKISLLTAISQNHFVHNLIRYNIYLNDFYRMTNSKCFIVVAPSHLYAHIDINLQNY